MQQYDRRPTNDDVITTAVCGEDVIRCHLEAALEHAECEEARFHLRQALQLLSESEQ